MHWVNRYYHFRFSTLPELLRLPKSKLLVVETEIFTGRGKWPSWRITNTVKALTRSAKRQFVFVLIWLLSSQNLNIFPVEQRIYVSLCITLYGLDIGKGEEIAGRHKQNINNCNDMQFYANCRRIFTRICIHSTYSVKKGWYIATSLSATQLASLCRVSCDKINAPYRHQMAPGFVRSREQPFLLLSTMDIALGHTSSTTATTRHAVRCGHWAEHIRTIGDTWRPSVDVDASARCNNSLKYLTL